ncbi:hypothetical protein BESB_025040 [Besnoitia besnoiti]|uniref:Uncharacterized protein n=1 Tax=Besnoitia besnoiti TaxID=94643 RepID=A0A2A9LYL7_BESBE|nr:uncharacterized protein BESB_025040 [Besnoitia besnoiti]PFH31538.1 hypothetical protein BESB_025040 [Besnoitia besnoiti]
MNQTRLFAHTKQNKGAKKWNRNRPKKTTPAHINPKPSVHPPNLLNFVNAPPEYHLAPAPEATPLLNRPKVARLLHLLWLLPRQCRRGSAAFIPGPVPCPLPKPERVPGSLEPPTPQQMREEAEYENFVVSQHAAIRARAAAFAAQFDQPLVNAAAAGVTTAAGKEIQALAYDDELRRDLEALKHFAEQRDDVAVRMLSEHLSLAVSPACLPGAEEDADTALASTSPSAGFSHSLEAAPPQMLACGADGEGSAEATNKPKWLPSHLRRARLRYSSAAALVREVCRSPLTRFNRLLISEAVDRWWSAWQHRRLAGIVKKKLGQLKRLGRQLKAGGVPADKLLEENAFERYRLLVDLPRSRFVANYMKRHASPWNPPLADGGEPGAADRERTDGGQGGFETPQDAPESPQGGAVWTSVDQARRRALKRAAFSELQSLGILQADGSVDIELLKELYRTRPAVPPRDAKAEARRRSLPGDRMSKHERHQQIKFRQAAVGLTLPASARQVETFEEWERREQSAEIGGKLARATGVFDALLREEFPEYEPLRDMFKLEEFLEAEYRQHTIKRELRKLYAEWLRHGMPEDPKKRSKSDFLVYWMRLSKRKRKALLYEERQLAPAGATNATLMRRIRERTVLEQAASTKHARQQEGAASAA